MHHSSRVITKLKGFICSSDIVWLFHVKLKHLKQETVCQDWKTKMEKNKKKKTKKYDS